eukprot:2543977-Lingulodinium_polyedra.AAC.1
MPLLVIKDRSTQCIGATMIQRKGHQDDYAVSYMTGVVLGLGWKRLLLRSDNEPALLSFLRRVTANLPGVEVVPQTSPEGDHAANGLAEVGVRELKAQTRVLRSQVESRLGARLARDDPLLAWLPRHAGNCMSRYRVLEDGRTPEHRRTGKRWRRPAVEF